MQRLKRAAYALALGVASLVIPASTYAGGGPGVGGGGGVSGLVVYVDHMPPMHHNYSFLDYFPRNTYIHQGDVVTFKWSRNANAIHTVSLLPAGAAPTDATINRYYPGAVNGVPDKDDNSQQIVFALPEHAQKNCGNSAYYPNTAPCVFDGTQPLNSRVMFPAVNPKTGNLVTAAPTPQFVVRVTAPAGTYHWICLIHGGGMNGTLHVLPPGAAVPSMAQQMQAAAQQYKVGAANAVAHESATASHIAPPTTHGGHKTWNVLVGDQYGRVEIDEFQPAHIAVKAGDSINYLPGGFHTVTSPDFPQPALQIDCEKPGAKDGPFTGAFVGCDLELGTGPGASPSGASGQAYTGKPLNSGIVVIPQPRTWNVSFPKAGSPLFVCFIHFNMGSSVTVQ